jgi:hypothetical protein
MTLKQTNKARTKTKDMLADASIKSATVQLAVFSTLIVCIALLAMFIG